jgi:hypothetical protein
VKRHSMAVALAFSLLLFSAPLMADTVTGTWKCVANNDGQTMQFTLELVQRGNAVTGNASRYDGSTDISKGSFENGKLKLLVEADGGEYSIEGELSGNTLKGKLSHTSGSSAPWEGKRQGGETAILGTWKMRTNAGGQVLESNMEFKKEGDALVGTIILPDGQTLRLQKASFAGDTLNFTVSLDQGDFPAEGKLEGNKLTGTYTTPGGQKDTWEATRI